MRRGEARRGCGGLRDLVCEFPQRWDRAEGDTREARSRAQAREVPSSRSEGRSPACPLPATDNVRPLDAEKLDTHWRLARRPRRCGRALPRIRSHLAHGLVDTAPTSRSSPPEGLTWVGLGAAVGGWLCGWMGMCGYAVFMWVGRWVGVGG